MSGNLLTASASGIEDYLPYVNILREYEDELTANGMDYEEHDRKAEPVTATLIISVAVTAVVSATLTEVVKKIVNRLSDESKAEESKKQSKLTIIILRIGGEEYDLRKDRDAAIAKIDALKTTAETSG